MLILHLISSTSIGGAERMLQRLVSVECCESRDKYIVVSMTGLGLVGNQMILAGVRVLSLEMKNLVDIPAGAVKLYKILQKFKPDVIQTWMYHADLLGGLIARICGIKRIVWGLRNTKIPQGKFSFTYIVLKICAILSYWIPHKIVACAESAKLSHVSYGYSRSKIVVIPNGYDFNEWSPSPNLRAVTRAKLNISANSIVIGHIGRFDPLKGQFDFLEACFALSEVNDNALFLMAGRDINSNNAALQRKILSSGYSKRFLLLDERKDIKELMCAMDIFCLSSRAEGFPNVVAEAMGMELPCVVTNVGDAALMIEDAGIVVSEQSPSDLFEALKYMIELPIKQRLFFGKVSRLLAKKKYSIDFISNQYSFFYKSLFFKGGGDVK